MLVLEKIKNRSIQSTTTVLQSLKKMDEAKVKMLFVFEDEQFLSILTIGDIQRAIIKQVDFNQSVSTIIDLDKQFVTPAETEEQIREKMLALRAECMPVVDKEGNLVDVYLWNDFFQSSEFNNRQKIKLPVVIMAGGKGTRLQPLTNIYPKPLIPIGEKTIIETIMDKFVDYDCHDFYLSVNYRADMIENYFEHLNNGQYNISYFYEDRPLGTAGSLRLLRDKLHSTFFVSNCDILIHDDYSEILKYHRQNQNELTVVAAVKTWSIPYGTINTGKDGLLESIEEKPSFTYQINTGLYILEPNVLDVIPDDFFHITHLMEKLKKLGRRVGVYPISQNDWVDMGDWKEYLKLINVNK